MFKALIGCILYIRPILAAIRTVIKYLIDTYILGIPCSYPGDAKENPLMRRGKWEFREFIPGPGYKFACDVESHKISQKSAPKYKMTGETAGRQIWYYDDKETQEYYGWKNPYDFSSWIYESTQEDIYKQFKYYLERGVEPSFLIETMRARSDDGWYPRRKTMLKARFLTK